MTLTLRSPNKNGSLLRPAPPVLPYLETLDLSSTSISFCLPRCGLFKGKAASNLHWDTQCPMHSWLWMNERMNVACNHLPRVLESAPTTSLLSPWWWESPHPSERSCLKQQLCGVLKMDTGPSCCEGRFPLEAHELWRPSGFNCGAKGWRTQRPLLFMPVASIPSQLHSLPGAFEKILWLYGWGVRICEEIDNPQYEILDSHPK